MASFNQEQQAARAGASRAADDARASSRLSCALFVSSASAILSASEFERMLARARRRNENAGLTGVLLQCDRNFMQYLEGPTDALAAMLLEIRSDPRHSGMLPMLLEHVAVRLFADEPLACFTSKSAGRPQGKVPDWLDARATVQRSKVQKLLTDFWTRGQRW